MTDSARLEAAIEAAWDACDSITPDMRGSRPRRDRGDAGRARPRRAAGGGTGR